MRTVTLTGVVVVLLFGSVAARPRVAESAPEPSNACALLTPAQVSTVLGVTVGPGVPLLAGHPEFCLWVQPGDKTHQSTRASVNYVGQVGKNTPAQRFAIGKTPIPGVTKTPAPGIGNDAFFTILPRAGTTLSVLKGDVAFEVHVFGFSDAEIQAKEKALALLVLAKL